VTVTVLFNVFTGEKYELAHLPHDLVIRGQEQLDRLHASALTREMYSGHSFARDVDLYKLALFSTFKQNVMDKMDVLQKRLMERSGKYAMAQLVFDLNSVQRMEYVSYSCEHRSSYSVVKVYGIRSSQCSHAFHFDLGSGVHNVHMRFILISADVRGFGGVAPCHEISDNGRVARLQRCSWNSQRIPEHRPVH